MQTKTTRKSFWQSITAIIGVTLIVGTGSAQTVTIDSAPSLNLRTAVDNSGLAFSSISIDPATGNAQVNTTGNVTSCGNPPAGTRLVSVTSPVNATPNSTINVSWVANNFIGATTCTVSLVAGSAVPTSGWTGTNLPYPATNTLSVVLNASQPALYNFKVDCSDGTPAIGSSNTNVPTTVGCGPDVGKWRGAALTANTVRIWETTFVSPGQTSTPFPGPVFSQLPTDLATGSYDSMRFTVPITAAVGARYNLKNFTPSSTSSQLAFSVAECQGDFREELLVNETTSRICLGIAGNLGAFVRLKVEPGSEPFASTTCPIVRGRDYYVNTTFGIEAGPVTSPIYCASGLCRHLLEYQIAR